MRNDDHHRVTEPACLRVASRGTNMQAKVQPLKTLWVLCSGVSDTFLKGFIQGVVAIHTRGGRKRGSE